MNLITGGTENIGIQKLEELTLDKLWEEAARLGRIKIDMDWKETTYTVSINFSRPSGTTIDAKGADSNIYWAMGKAINEAREMGAVEKEQIQ